MSTRVDFLKKFKTISITLWNKKIFRVWFMRVTPSFALTHAPVST